MVESLVIVQIVGFSKWELKCESKYFHCYCCFALTYCRRYCCIWCLPRWVKWLAAINPNCRSLAMVFQALQLSKLDSLLSFRWVSLRQANQSHCPEFFPTDCRDNWICMMSATRESLQFFPNLVQHLLNSAYADDRVWYLSDWEMSERTTCPADMALLSWISFVPMSWQLYSFVMTVRHHHYSDNHLCLNWIDVAAVVMNRVCCPNDSNHKCICLRWLVSNCFRMVISTYSDCTANWGLRNLQTFYTFCPMKHSMAMALNDQNWLSPWVMCPMGVQKVCAAVD